TGRRLGIGTDDKWISLNSNDHPDSAWVVLLMTPAAGALDAAGGLGVDVSSITGLGIPEIPSFSPSTFLPGNLLSGGMSPLTLVSELVSGIDIFALVNKVTGDVIPDIAAAKVTAEDNWTHHFTVSKYLLGLPMEFSGAEVGSQLLRWVIQFFTGFDTPVSYNPFDNFISVPMKAFGDATAFAKAVASLDLSKIIDAGENISVNDIKTILGDPSSILFSGYKKWANVINVRIKIPGPPWVDKDKIVVKKIWKNDKESTRPDWIKIHVYAGDEEIAGSPVVMNKKDYAGQSEWVGRIKLNEEMIKHLKDKQLYAEEELPADYRYKDNYVTSRDGNTFTNKWYEDIPDTVDVEGQKIWDDSNNKDKIRPGKVTVRLYANGKEIAYVSTDATQDWRYFFPKLPRKDQSGKTIKYTVGEDPVSGYETRIKGYNIVNVHKSEKMDVNVVKVWEDEDDRDGVRPESITIRLRADGKVIDEKEVKESDDWKCTFKDLQTFINDREIVYTVTEDVIPGYETRIEGSASLGFTVTNTYDSETVDKTQITVSKVWSDSDNSDGIRPDKVTVNLLANGAATGKSVELSSENNWTDTFTKLDVKDAADTPISYTVEEVKDEKVITGTDGPGTYAVGITGTAAEGYTVTNTHTPEIIDISGTKTWVDNDNAAGARPGRINIRLYANGREIDSQIVTESAGWAWTFEKLPKRANGKEIVYTISEDAVNNYTPSVSGYDITNVYTPGKTAVTVRKVWDDKNDWDNIRPDSVTVQLFADGQYTGKSAVLDENNKWSHVFTGLDIAKGSTRIAYTVAEVEDVRITGVNAKDTYSYRITGSAYTGFVVTNIHTPKRGKNQVIVMYFPNGGRFDDNIPVHMEYNDMNAIVSVEKAPKREGWRFIGWKYKDNYDVDNIKIKDIDIARIVPTDAYGNPVYLGTRLIAAVDVPEKGDMYDPDEDLLLNHSIQVLAAQWVEDPDVTTTVTPTPTPTTTPTPTVTPVPSTTPVPDDPGHHNDGPSPSVTPVPTGSVIPVITLAPQNPGNDPASATGRGHKGSNPNTGDDSLIWLWAIIFVLSASTVVITVVRGRRKKKEHK
ncbi:MAG: Cna B-type domain-containing protein, partial [Lachnospiraceae bacterium]|nr:Cna B-type domain-containing protein [Lachnospiraceae bacterium]